MHILLVHFYMIPGNWELQTDPPPQQTPASSNMSSPHPASLLSAAFLQDPFVPC